METLCAPLRKEKKPLIFSQPLHGQDYNRKSENLGSRWEKTPIFFLKKCDKMAININSGMSGGVEPVKHPYLQFLAEWTVHPKRIDVGSATQAR